MKVLNTNDFLFERVKVQPVTNAEWEKAKQDVDEIMLHDSYLLKNRLHEFDIVMNSFSESPFLVVKSPDLIKTLNLDIQELKEALKEGLALYYHGSGGTGYAYVFLSRYEKDLTYRWNKVWNISKIYRRNTEGEVKVYNAADLMDIANTKSLEMLKKHFKLIFER